MGKLIAGFVLIGLGVLMGLCAFAVVVFGTGFGMEDDPETYWRAGDTATVLLVGSLALIPGMWFVVSGFANAKPPRERAGITSIVVGATYFVVSAFLALADQRGGIGGEYLFAVMVGGIPMLLGVALLARGSASRVLPPTSSRCTKKPPRSGP